MSVYVGINVILYLIDFKNNLHLLTNDGKYNIMAQLLSDNSYIPIRVAIFEGKTKANKLYSVKEFGYKCLLYSLYEVLSYGEILNIPQADENDRIMERKESIEVNDNNLTVTIPFNRVNENNKVGNKVGNKVCNKNLNNSQIKVLTEIRNNLMLLNNNL